ncbi:DUF3955 domain-containing protein [Herbaspirillum sp. RV1423]|uniref:DUF3955 domain-containing protein n=1 Tax=Herbaspirillum sp. RV1423 TaxID=1443993 RepID=UPI0004B28AD8|nr:DUF3955 domain-containing protein [Herbaspirillum sp. RV1423]
MTSPASRKMLRLTVTLVVIGVVCFISSGLAGTEIDVQGVLHEPFFFLIPLGWLCIFSGVVSGVIAYCLHRMQSFRKHAPEPERL